MLSVATRRRAKLQTCPPPSCRRSCPPPCRPVSSSIALACCKHARAASYGERGARCCGGVPDNLYALRGSTSRSVALNTKLSHLATILANLAVDCAMDQSARFAPWRSGTVSYDRNVFYTLTMARRRLSKASASSSAEDTWTWPSPELADTQTNPCDAAQRLAPQRAKARGTTKGERAALERPRARACGERERAGAAAAPEARRQRPSACAAAHPPGLVWCESHERSHRSPWLESVSSEKLRKGRCHAQTCGVAQATHPPVCAPLEDGWARWEPGKGEPGALSEPRPSRVSCRAP